MWHLWQQQQHLWHRDRHMEAFVFMFCSVSHAARYTHFHSKLVCRLTPPPPPSSLLPPHCTVGRVRPAAQPPAHPAVICNTIRFAAAVDSPARGLGGGWDACTRREKWTRSGSVRHLMHFSALLHCCQLYERTQAGQREGGDGNSSLGIFNLTMRAIYVGISWRAF